VISEDSVFEIYKSKLKYHVPQERHGLRKWCGW